MRRVKMGSIRGIILCGLLFTCIKGQEQNLIESLVKRIEALEYQGIEQRKLIDQQGQLLRNYADKLKQYEVKLKELSEGKEKTEPSKETIETTDVAKPEAEGDLLEVLTDTSNERFEDSKFRRHFRGFNNGKRPRLVLDNVEGPIAFHATNDKGITPNVGLNQHILFEDVHLNSGNAFHALHGLFIAPRAGIYIFSTSIMTQVSLGDISASIEVNGVDVARAYANGNSGVPDQGSVTVVVQLKAGDEVWVKSYDRTSAAEYGDKFSSFMGCLIMDI